MTASMTPCVTTARSWICEPTPVHTSPPATPCDDSPVLDLRTLTLTHTRRHLQRHPVWQPGLGSANPDLLHTPDDTSNDTLCDSPVLDLRTLTATHTRRHLQRHPVWQPGLGSANPDRTPTHTRRHLQWHPVWQPPRNESTKSANPHPPTWSKNPYS